MFNEKVLENKVALVTGGGRGIGKAIVTELAKAGAEVIFCYHASADKALAVQEDLRNQGLKVTAIKMDVRDRNQVLGVVEEIATKYNGQIDVLVNNSGIVKDGLLMGFTEEEIRAVLDTNIMGVFNVTQAVVPYMTRKRSGKIINISSVSGNAPGRGQSNYAASKGAINAFTKAMAVELAPRKITVNAIAPGVFETDISKDVRDAAADQILAEILLKRFGKPEEVAYLATFLASKYADYINGQILYVDGGFKMG